jgi:type III secretion protein J
VFLSGCLHRTLLTGLDESEAREVAVALYKGNVRSRVVKEARGKNQENTSWQVDVQGGDRTQVEAWRILLENGLPRFREEGIGDVYKNSQLIPTASEERAKFLLALSGELSRSLKAIPGVVDARVHVVIPDTTVLRDPNDKPHATASVLMKYWSTYSEPPKDQVARLVANGVEGLQEKDISIMTAKLTPPQRDGLDDLSKSVAPTVGLAIDYVFWWGSILGIIIIGWMALNFAPGLIRWGRTQFLALRESLVD